MVDVGLLQLLLDRPLARNLSNGFSSSPDRLPTRPIPQSDDLDPTEVSQRSTSLGYWKSWFKMIPDTETVCQSSEAATDTQNMFEKINNCPEKEAASVVTAWKRYQQLAAMMESRGGKFNRKSMIEAIFRGHDLVYTSSH